MELLPLFHHLSQRPVVVVGGGEVALRKCRLLARAGAKIRVIAPDVVSELEDLLQEHQGQIVLRDYQSSDVENAVLVIAATNNTAVNEHVSLDAKALNVPVNVVDSPDLCTVVFPAIVDRSPIMVAISSGGHAPVLTRVLRGKLETQLPIAYAQLAQFARFNRKAVKQRFEDVHERRIFWENVLQGHIAEMIFAGNVDKAQKEIEKALESGQEPQGELYWISVLTDDPELLTFKALRLMQQADMVYYNDALSPNIVDLCRRDADLIGVDNDENITAERFLPWLQQGKRVVCLSDKPLSSQYVKTVVKRCEEEGVICIQVPSVNTLKG